MRNKSLLLKTNFILSVLFFLLVSNQCFSQIKSENEAKSIEQKLDKQEYSEKVKSYQSLISFYSRVSLEKALHFSNEFVQLAKQNNDKRMQAEALNLLGRTNIRMGKFTEAKQIHVEALFLYQSLKNDTGVAAQYGNLGVIFEMSGDFSKALLFYQKALKKYELLEDKKSIAFVENNIGIVYQEMNQFKQALKSFQKAFAHKKEQSDSSGMASTLNNIGVLYESLKNDFNQALFYYTESFEIYDKTNNQLQKGTLLNNIGLIYLKQGKIDSANRFLSEALSIRQLLNDMYGVASTTLNLAQLELKQKNANKAIALSQKSIQLFTEIGSNTKMSESYQTHALACEMNQQFREALESQKKYIQFRDSVLNETNQKAMHEMQARFENEVNQKQLTILEKENAIKDQRLNQNIWTIISLSTLFLMILLVVFFFVRQHRLRLQHRQLIVEQKLFRAQMNPHFIFNALSSIQAFIQNNNKDLGSKYITQFARLMRRILDYSTKEFIPLSDELEVLTDYIEFQRLRFSNSFQFELIMDENLESDLINVPPMLLQPFVENAIEHGIRNVENAWIKVHLSMQNQHLIVRIIDNGIGIEKSKRLKKNHEHQSMALQITSERLLLLSKSNKNNPQIRIIDCSQINPTGTGTEVSFEIPVISK